MATKEKVRTAAVAGSFYPKDKATLEKMIAGFLEDCAKPRTSGKLRALIVPHAGYVYSGPIAASGYNLIRKLNPQPKNIILLGPSHYAGFYGMARPESTEWDTPLSKTKAGKIEDICGSSNLVLASEEAHVPEHSLEVQLPFLQSVMKKEFGIFPLLCNEINAEEAARYIEPALKDEKKFLLVSSDLSHYLTYKDAKETDERTSRIIEMLDLKNLDALDACGRMGIEIAMNIALDLRWRCQALDCRNSGDTAGEKDRVVGYGCYGFFEK